MSTKVAWISAELAPFVKVGGLADVSSALPKELKRLNVDVRIIIPYYTNIVINGLQRTEIYLEDPFGEEIQIYETKDELSGVIIYLLKHPIFLDEPYKGDLNAKFTMFNLLTANFILINKKWTPDIIHTNDWHTGLLPYLMRKHKEIKNIFTIHNIAFQGKMSIDHLKSLFIDVDELEISNNEVNFMKIAIGFSDQITTVSEKYAEEILTREYSFGLDDDLQNHSNKVVGILNGIDSSIYDPSGDEVLLVKYDVKNIQKRFENKIDLLNKLEFKYSEGLLIGLTTRLYDQKGIDLLIDSIPSIINMGINIVVLGTGDQKYESKLSDIEKKFPNNFKFLNYYNEKISHQIFAGVDCLLIPSRYEPCGLTQMYAMRYGAVPIVRATGGLADTVIENNSKQNGFLFEKYLMDDLIFAINRANKAFENKIKWMEIQKNGMQRDWSWKKSALKWVNLYNKNLGND